MKRFDRRDFLKGTIALAGLSILSPLNKKGGLLFREIPLPGNFSLKGNNASESGENKEGTRFGMVIDVGACIGCRTCMWGCKKENNISDTMSAYWIELFQMDYGISLIGHVPLDELEAGATTSYSKSPLEDKWYLPVQCNHCDNPPCVKVCPTGATYKADDGIVMMDYEKCIGCRFCVVSCPYNARRFNWFKPELRPEEINDKVPVRPLGVVEKCTFCAHRTREGKLPRCVEVCPVKARRFGDLNDPESQVSKIINSKINYRLLEELNTEPNIRYTGEGKKWLGA